MPLACSAVQRSFPPFATVRWCAAAATILGPETVRPCLLDVLRPVLRVLNAPSTSNTQGVRELAEEVQGILRDSIDAQELSTAYHLLQSRKAKAKEGRKKTLKAEAMLDPEGHAKRKLHKSQKNKALKKRKLHAVIAHKAKTRAAHQPAGQ
ncbi:hypothetical protein CYMTET_35391 [Cymbomonas tetramitiformis]|uniref:U3 small nucleolar RNA-associated protein 20 C-terminal domain-containing protein n=1 Tax=Cymbomonas tetramitiformis TaxID=36881 RepID=A0AAE0KNZ9_9CHLO|nr:hypothetical protein CYMTET_35391 [Cymbomonas tetramitiformis]